MKKALLSVLVALALCAASLVSGGAGNAAAATQVVFKLSHNFTPQQTLHLAMERVAKNVNERTGGAVVFQIYPNAEIANGLDGVEQCLRGATFINVYDPSCLADWVPDYSALIGPMLYTSPAEFSAMCQTPFALGLNKKAEEAGIKMLALDYTFGMRNIATVRKPIGSVDDLAGMKIRVPKSQLWVDTFMALGASPVAISWGEVYNALQQGVVDGMESSNSDMADSAIQEVAKYIANTGHFTGTASVMMSKKVWDSLTPEQQAVIQEEFAAGAAWNNEMSLQDEEGAKQKMMAAGVAFNDLDLQPFRDKTKVVFDKFPNLTPGVYDAIQVELKKIRGQ
jgi:tripartite ATP-independent transporter DctP family solute receptor